MLHVIEPGPFATIQDLGRPGLGALGVPRSGALDREALRLANRLVGNPDDAAALEITLGGLVVEVLRPVLVALTGAACASAVSGGPPVGHAAPVALPAGSLIRVGTPRSGMRTYLAVRGGLAVPPVLGSRSYDSLSKLGPPPLRSGDMLTAGPDPGTPVRVELAPTRSPSSTVQLWPGPRADWFADAIEVLTSTTWTVGSESDRIGARLEGARLERVHPGELPSEGIVEGAVQVPHDGRPIVMLADHPTTGGYPVVAVVDPVDLAVVAQTRPGELLRFARSRGCATGHR